MGEATVSRKWPRDCPPISHWGPSLCSSSTHLFLGEGAWDLVHHQLGWLEPQLLVKKKAFSGQSSLQGGREEEKGKRLR